MTNLKNILTQDFFIGNSGNNKVTKKIIEEYSLITNSRLDEYTEYDKVSSFGTDELPIISKSVRSCRINWLDVSKKSFTESVLRKLLETTNKIFWNLDLENEWESNIQYTKYIGKGEHYNWHRDYYSTSDLSKSLLSIVYCLSHKSEYEGGEFEILQSNGSTYSIKFDYGDFIIFPSEKLHRVVPLESGIRSTIVGWYQ